MLKRVLIVVGVLALVVAVGVWFLIAPRRLPASELAAAHTPDVANGQTMFIAGNCSACHATPGQDDRTKLGGGLKLKSPFGTFVTPNISPDAKHGIGGWSELEFVNAMKRGVDDEGHHLYPAFPYATY